VQRCCADQRGGTHADTTDAVHCCADHADRVADPYTDA